METALSRHERDEEDDDDFMCESHGSGVGFNETWKLTRLKTEMLSVHVSRKGVEY